MLGLFKQYSSSPSPSHLRNAEAVSELVSESPSPAANDLKDKTTDAPTVSPSPVANIPSKANEFDNDDYNP